ncbi:leucine rich repeat domain-containing protein [Histoplasma capsulatum G186AR]|uniref:Leucine rich repeat domain-containing protein n=1 Tax=Ajellomyces capsulatus TaxID=5037 RepID=A0A8H7Z9E7_AJECA|nr:leucine rich repeat domain-containing protein [Histoplasma capsulatum]QSS69061.1 leucine rich repeat domain-containing protein [Histoplasma capsulatum G186AR]
MREDTIRDCVEGHPYTVISFCVVLYSSSLII